MCVTISACFSRATFVAAQRAIRISATHQPLTAIQVKPVSWSYWWRNSFQPLARKSITSRLANENSNRMEYFYMTKTFSSFRFFWTIVLGFGLGWLENSSGQCDTGAASDSSCRRATSCLGWGKLWPVMDRFSSSTPSVDRMVERLDGLIALVMDLIL